MADNSLITLPQVNVPNAYTGPGSVTLPYAPGWSASAGSNPFAGANPFIQLPDLPSLGDFFKDFTFPGSPVDMGVAGKGDVGGQIAETLGPAAWYLTGRVVVVVVGLLFIVAGLYLFGTSQVADSIAGAVKKSVA